MPTHSLPPAHQRAGAGVRNLDTGTVSVAHNGTTDTGFNTVTQAFANATGSNAYAVNVYQTANGELYFDIYDIESSTDQSGAINVDYLAICERE